MANAWEIVAVLRAGIVSAMPLLARAGIAGALLLFAFAAAPSRGDEPLEADVTVATVDGEPVERREFELHLRAAAAEVVAYFHQQHGAVDGDDFWRREFAGEIPLERARRIALAAATRSHVQGALARRHGLARDLRYRTFLATWRQENQRRRAAVAKGGVIYGPKQYKEADFFTHVTTNQTIQLKAKLAEGDLAVSDGELAEAYRRGRESRFRLDDTLTVRRLAVNGLRTADASGDAAAAEADQLLRAIAADLERGVPTDQIPRTTHGGGKVEATPLVFSAATTRRDFEQFPQTRTIAAQLEVGAVSSVFEENSERVVVQLLNREPAGYRPLAEIATSLRMELIDHKYAALVDALVRDAKVVVIPELFNATEIR